MQSKQTDRLSGMVGRLLQKSSVHSANMQKVSLAMQIRRLVSFFVVVLSLAIVVGCSRDPNVRKQKYLESGKRYFEKEKYREATIQFSNSLQVDPNFAAAHYQLARTYMKMGSWSSAFNELNKTLHLDPSNLDAHLDLGNLMLAARQLDQAQREA